MILMFLFFVLFSLLQTQNYLYQIIKIDEIGSNDKTAANSSQLQKMLLGTQEVTAEMKNLLITNPNATEPPATSPVSDAAVKSDVKPNASTTSSLSSPASVPSKTEQ